MFDIKATPDPLTASLNQFAAATLAVVCSECPEVIATGIAELSLREANALAIAHHLARHRGTPTDDWPQGNGEASLWARVRHVWRWLALGAAYAALSVTVGCLPKGDAPTPPPPTERPLQTGVQPPASPAQTF